MIVTSSCSRPSRPPPQPRQRQPRRNSRPPSSQPGITENTQAVSSLQGAVTDLKTNNTSSTTTIQDNQAKVEKQITNPDVIHFKGITLSPTGSFLAGETVYRTNATGSDIPTPFSSLPYEHADAYALSEFYGTARQSRVALMAEGHTGSATLRGYYEADWLGTGVSSNNNESNSYVFRQRVLWGQAALNNGWAFTGGQLWSLATEDRKGISNLSGDILLPLTIDPNYVPGFVWERQYGFRVTKTIDNAAFGIAAENPQLLYTATLAGNTPYAVLGSAGTNGGLYNAAISTCSPSTSIVNYTNQVNGGVDTYLPVYKTVNACANIANYSFNTMPDIIVKAAFDPSFGHFEVFGIGRYAHETVYPGETTNGNLYGGLKDITTGATVAPALTTAGSYNNSIALGGLGASGRVYRARQEADSGSQGSLRTGCWALWRHHALRRYLRGQWRILAPAQPLRPEHGRVCRHSPPHPVPELRRGLRRSQLLVRHHARRAHGSAKCHHQGMGRSLGCASRRASRLRLLLPQQLRLPHHCRSRLQREFHRLLPRRKLRRPDQRRPGNHRRRMVRLLQGRLWPLAPGSAVRLRRAQSWTGLPVAGNGPDGVGAKGIDNMFFTSFRYYLP